MTVACGADQSGRAVAAGPHAGDLAERRRRTERADGLLCDSEDSFVTFCDFDLTVVCSLCIKSNTQQVATRQGNPAPSRDVTVSFTAGVPVAAGTASWKLPTLVRGLPGLLGGQRVVALDRRPEDSVPDDGGWRGVAASAGGEADSAGEVKVDVSAEGRADSKPPVSTDERAVAAVTEFDKAVAVFRRLFETDSDVRSARMKFRKCAQGNESNVIYLANLREAVVSCNFGALTDEMLRDKFIEGCRSDQLRDKLIMIDDLSLSLV